MYAWDHLSCILGIICRKKLEMIPSIQEVCFDYMQNLSHFIQCPSTSSGAETDPGWVSRNYYVYQMLQMTNRIIKQREEARSFDN